MRPFDVCVVGHVTRDVIRSDRARRLSAGGVAYYSALTLRRLGRRVAVVTKMAHEDRSELLSELHSEGITVFCSDSTETTVFHNLHSKGDPDRRTQTVTSVAAPFARTDLGDVCAQWFYLGPLSSQDMSLEFVQAARVRGAVALDAQGLVRKIEGEKIQAVRPAETGAFLRSVSLLKVDEREAAVLSQEDGLDEAARRLYELGPEEVIVTSGSKGSIVFDGRNVHRIDSVAGEEVDATGCGDTYLAAYLDRRLASDDPALAGRFAAAAATLTLEREGAFQASESEVRARMA